MEGGGGGAWQAFGELMRVGPEGLSKKQFMLFPSARLVQGGQGRVLWAMNNKASAGAWATRSSAPRLAGCVLEGGAPMRRCGWAFCRCSCLPTATPTSCRAHTGCPARRSRCWYTTPSRCPRPAAPAAPPRRLHRLARMRKPTARARQQAWQSS